jgi:hypothetical protein
MDFHFILSQDLVGRKLISVSTLILLGFFRSTSKIIKGMDIDDHCRRLSEICLHPAAQPPSDHEATRYIKEISHNSGNYSIPNVEQVAGEPLS